MRRSAILLLGVIFLAIVSSATAQGNLFVKGTNAGSTGQDGDFERFWKILSNVSPLVVEVNSSPSYDNVHELIKWTRLGEENAGNISALAWESLLDLKNSGAKLHYTADELRSMAALTPGKVTSWFSHTAPGVKSRFWENWSSPPASRTLEKQRRWR